MKPSLKKDIKVCIITEAETGSAGLAGYFSYYVLLLNSTALFDRLILLRCM